MPPSRNPGPRRFTTSRRATRHPSIPTTSTRRIRRLQSIAPYRPACRRASPMHTPNPPGTACRSRPSPLRRSSKRRRAQVPKPGRLRRRHRSHRVPHWKLPSRIRWNLQRRWPQPLKAPHRRQHGRGRLRRRNRPRRIRLSPRNCRNRRLPLNRLPPCKRLRQALRRRSSAPPTVRPCKRVHPPQALRLSPLLPRRMV